MFPDTMGLSFKIGYDIQKIMKNVYIGDEDSSKNK